MATNYIAPTWRMPENTNKDRFSNYSLEFNGTNEYITFPETNFLKNGKASFSFWMKPKTWPGGNNYGYFLSGTNPTGGLAYSEGSSSGAYYPGVLYWYNGSTSTILDVTLTENVWSHVVIVFDGTSLRTYKDGNLETTKTIVQPSSLLFNTMGRYTPNNTHYINGFLSEFSIFNYALAQSQVTYLYNLNNPMAITGVKPIAYWPLGDNSNPRALAGYPNLSVGGSVFNFNGIDNAIDCGIGSRFDIDQITISNWVKFDSVSPVLQLISGIRNTNNGLMPYTLSAYNNAGIVKKFRFIINQSSDGANKIIYSNDSYEVDTWYHVVCVADGSNVKLYVNGVLQTDQTTYDGTITSPTQNFNIGRQPSAPLYYLDGQVSNVAVFNTGLSQSQVETLYNNGLPGDISSLNPTAWYKLDSSEIFNSTSTEWSVDNNAYPSTYKGSLEFTNGSNNYIDLGSTDVLINALQSFSFSAWVKLDSYQGFPGIARLKTTTNKSWIIFLSNSNNYLGLNFGAESGFARVKTAGDISGDFIGQWKHVCITFDGVDYTASSSYEVYIDSSPVSLTASYLFSSVPNSSSLGYLSSSGNAFNGLISNVSVFNTELSQSQVTTLYNNGAPEASISHSPVSWWKLNNTTTGIQDSAGSINGTNNGVTEYAGFVSSLAGESVSMDSSNLVQSNLDSTTPYSNYSVSFNGGTEYMRTPTNYGSYLSGATSCSVSVWVKVDNNSVQQPVVSCWGTSSNTKKSYLIRYLNDSRRFQFYLWGPVGTLDSRFGLANAGVPISANRWYHIVGTWDGTTIKIYQDGVFEGFENAPGGALQTVDDQNWTGRYSSTFMQGDVSNQAFWKNTVLTQSEITEIYNAGVTTDLNNFSGTAPTVWYPMDENSTYFPGVNHPTDLYIRDVINDRYSAGLNMDTSNFVGYAPGSNTNGTGSNLDISNLKGDMGGSTKNSYSVNMADYGDPNGQGVTPANSGRTTSVPG